jgi:predicted MFS family arabinose efflux permease
VSAILSRVIPRLRDNLADSARSFRSVFRNVNLRRLELAWMGSITGEWAYFVALAVFAYESGGARAVGLVAAIRWIPAAIGSPFLALLGDRYRRERVLLGADLSRAAAMTLAAVAALADAPAPVVYALAAFVALASKTFRPAQAALLPSLARSPEELTAANVTSTAIESTGSVAGAALGGLLVAFASPGVVFAATAGTFLWSALLVARIRSPAAQEAPPGGRVGVARRVLAGFTAIAGDRHLRLLVGLYAAQTLVAGALNVFIVVAAIELLDFGKAGVGFLNSAFGIGGIAGVAAAFLLVGRRRLASDFAVGIVLWGAGLALVGVWPHPAAALFLLGLVGVGNTLVDVAGVTLLQRAVADDVLARAFGALESLLVGTLGLGALLAPPLISLLGIRGSLIVAGTLLTVLALLAWRRLRLLDAPEVPDDRLALLRSISFFGPLPHAALEHLALALRPVHVDGGAYVFEQGGPGDRFYVIKEGEVEVSVDGSPARTHEPGDYFGEIALLRDVPRTASIRARGDVELYALGRDEFIAAVTGHTRSLDAANAVIAARLGSFRGAAGAL